MLALSIDPGDTSGFAVAEITPTTFVHGSTGTMQAWTGLDELLDRFRPTLVLYETFRLFPSKAKKLAGSELLAPQVIGVLLYLCQKRSITALGRQPSAKNLPIIPRDAVLISFVKALKTEHERDAVMHLYAYWRTCVVES